MYSVHISLLFLHCCIHDTYESVVVCNSGTSTMTPAGRTGDKQYVGCWEVSEGMETPCDGTWLILIFVSEISNWMD